MRTHQKICQITADVIDFKLPSICHMYEFLVCCPLTEHILYSRSKRSVIARTFAWIQEVSVMVQEEITQNVEIFALVQGNIFPFSIQVPSIYYVITFIGEGDSSKVNFSFFQVYTTFGVQTFKGQGLSQEFETEGATCYIE